MKKTLFTTIALSISFLALPVFAGGLPSGISGTYDCYMVDGNGSGEYRTNLTSRCRYETGVALTFRYDRTNTGFDYSGVRTMTHAEKRVPAYWLAHQGELTFLQAFEIETFLTGAKNAPITYVLENDHHGSVELVFAYPSSGHSFVIRVYTQNGTMIDGHVPAEFWGTSP